MDKYDDINEHKIDIYKVILMILGLDIHEAKIETPQINAFKLDIHGNLSLF